MHVKCVMLNLKASSITQTKVALGLIIDKGYRTLPCSVSEQLKTHAERGQNFFLLA